MFRRNSKIRHILCLCGRTLALQWRTQKCKVTTWSVIRMVIPDNLTHNDASKSQWTENDSHLHFKLEQVQFFTEKQNQRIKARGSYQKIRDYKKNSLRSSFKLAEMMMTKESFPFPWKSVGDGAIWDQLAGYRCPRGSHLSVCAGCQSWKPGTEQELPRSLHRTLCPVLRISSRSCYSPLHAAELSPGPGLLFTLYTL